MQWQCDREVVNVVVVGRCPSFLVPSGHHHEIWLLRRMDLLNNNKGRPFSKLLEPALSWGTYPLTILTKQKDLYNFTTVEIAFLVGKVANYFLGASTTTI